MTNPTVIHTSPLEDPVLYRSLCEEIEEKLRRAKDTFVDRYPHISSLPSEGLTYTPMENNLWTTSFFCGEMYLAAERTGDPAFLSHRLDYRKSFTDRLDRQVHITHDLGFLYTLTAVADYHLTKDPDSLALARRAADMLSERYNEKGGFIQAWGTFGKGNPWVKMIADTMLNLPLLFKVGDEREKAIAKTHADTCAKYIVREDFSSFHTYLMDPESGKAVVGRTHQGYRDASTWARGQAWIVTGFALAYSYTKDPYHLEVSRKAADYFLSHLPEDHVPYWDFAFNDRVPDIRDTSAATIFTCGLLELSKWVDPEESVRLRGEAAKIVRSLYDHYFLHDPDRAGILTDGMYHREDGSTCTSWGDYFFYETLIRFLNPDWKRFW